MKKIHLNILFPVFFSIQVKFIHLNYANYTTSHVTAAIKSLQGDVKKPGFCDVKKLDNDKSFTKCMLG